MRPSAQLSVMHAGDATMATLIGMGFTAHTFQVYSSLYKTAGRELPKAFQPAPAHAMLPPPVTLPTPKGNAPGQVPGTGAYPARGRSISPSLFANSAVSAGEADPFIHAPALLAMTALKAQCIIHVWLRKLLTGTPGRY